MCIYPWTVTFILISVYVLIDLIEVFKHSWMYNMKGVLSLHRKKVVSKKGMIYQQFLKSTYRRVGRSTKC